MVSDAMLKKLDAWWRASNFLSAGQLYLLDNPLLKEPLKPEHIKKKIVGHWGTVPGQNFIYTHLNRIINQYDLNMIYLSGPGHGGNAMVAQDWLDGSYSEVYPNVSQDIEGMQKLFKQFSFPGGISSHVAPEVPGSINEGGELGYSLSHAFGAVMDNPDLIAACVVGDGEAGKPCGAGRAGVLGARPAEQANAGHFTGVFHFFHRIIHKMVETCRLPGFFSECSQNVFRKFGGFFKKGA